jgi:hypothetical protein
MDRHSKTDAFVVIWQMKGKQKQRIGQTEVVADNLDPEFVTTINIDYFFEQQQNLRLDIYDADDVTQLSNLQKQEYIGSYDFVLGKLVSSKNQELTAEIANPARKAGKSGSIKIMALEKKADFGKTQAKFTLSTDVHSNGPSFLVISRAKGQGQYQPVYKSESKGSMGGKITWNQILLDTDTLCNADNFCEIFFQIF